MSVERFARVTDPDLNAQRGAIRRMVVSRASTVLWQLLGFTVERKKETTRGVEVFHGVGISAIPSESGKPEAIVVNVGGATAPVVIASRDEKTRAAMVPSGMKAGETCIYSEGAVIYVRADGTVEVRTPAGTAKSLATKDDVKLLADFVNTLLVGGTGSAVIPPNTVPRPTGTTVLKGQ
jgi:phage gp45-like